MIARAASALALVVGLVATAPARAQAPSASVTMSADRTRVAAGERFQLRIEARCQGAANPEVQPPPLDDFDLVGRHVNTPFSLRFGFGGGQQVQSTVRHMFTLVAREPGSFELSPAVVTLGGQRFESNPLTIEVTDGAGGVGASGQPSQAAAGQLTPGTFLDGMEFDAGGFLRTTVSPPNPFVGQQVTVSVSLYYPGPIRAQPQFEQEPTTNGFWTRDLLPAQRELRTTSQNIGGRTFQVVTLRHIAAFPLSAGELTVGPATVRMEQRSIFDALRGGGESWVRNGVPVTVPVRDLPEAGRPDGPVHVGELSLTTELDRSSIATGDAATLTLTATGTGAIRQLSIPTPSVDGLRVLEPEVRDTVNTPGGVVSGSRILRWLVVPEREGDYELGPFEVPVFDPTTETYGVARAEALTLVAAGSGPATPEATEPSADDAPDEGEDEARASFGPVRTQSELARSPTVLSEQGGFLATLALGPLALLLGLIVRIGRRQLERDDPKAAPRKARRAAKKRLAEAREHAEADDPGSFYAAIASALKQVLEAKLGRAVGSLTHPELRRLLAERGMDEALAERLVDELEGCDFARFSAVGVTGDEMKDCLGRADDLLTALSRFEPTPEEES